MFIAFALFSILNTLILFASSGKENRGNTYLALIFLCVSIRGFESRISLLALHPTLQKFFFINFLPLFFLFGPVLYFYIRYEVLGKSFKLKRDFKHFLVFSMSIINMIPYYLNSNNFKDNVIELAIENPIKYLRIDSLMANYQVYYIGGPIHSLFYLTLSLYIVSNKNKQLSKKLNDDAYEVLIKWLYTFITIFYAFIISNLIFATYVYITKNQLHILPTIFTGILFLYLNIQVYKHPQMLFGIKFSKSPSGNRIVHIKKVKPIIALDTSFEIKFNKKMEQYQVNKAYNTSDFNLAFIANDLEVPEYILNDYFKNHLKVKFTDFRNEIRIKDFYETINKKDFQRYTANAIANKYGFSHINSLKKAFNVYQSESYEAFQSKLMNN